MGGDKRNFRKDFKNKNNNRELGLILPERQELTCVLCGELIKDLASSMAVPETGEPAHFDCVMKELEKNETLAEGESIAYLGSGGFGIIKHSTQNPAGFEIRKKIEFENKEKIGSWRKKLSYKI